MNKEQLSQLESIDGINKIVQKNPVTFINGDNMKFLRWCKENMLYKHFHVGIVDPPYGISVGNMKLGATANSKPREYEMGNWDNEVPTLEYWYLLNYCCRNLIIWGGNYFTEDFGRFLVTIDNDGKECIHNEKSLEDFDFSNLKSIRLDRGIKAGRCALAWDKMNNGMSFADFELAITTFDSVARIIKKSRNIKEEDGDKRHPTQKPVYLYDYLHINFVEKGQKVLDTHGGSHSHAIAAYQNNIDLTIIEREASYFNTGIAEYEKASVKPQRLF